MIEWVPIEEFLEKQKDQKEDFLVLASDKYVIITSLYTYPHSAMPEVYTHAAKINFPVEKTLEEKFYELYCKSSTNPNLFKDLAKIAKEHYEGEK